MILTGSKIKQEVKKSSIIIDPFDEKQLNPNSYNYRISNKLVCFKIFNKKIRRNSIVIPKTGFVIKPQTTYLANTYEILGSKKYAMSLIGRSSLGRLGLFLQVSANLGHTGSIHKWTLELVSTKPFKIYPHMIIGQISFWTNKGDIIPYTKGYSDFDVPKTSKLERRLLK